MILGILQARTSSTRLPGKVLKPLIGKPMIVRQLERLAKARNIDKLVVATSSLPGDDALAAVCEAVGVSCFRGSLDDVLDRFYQAAKIYKPQHIVRLTGDCPLADHEVIDRVIAAHAAGNYDYTSNVIEPSYPDGLDAEIFTAEALATAWQQAATSAEREHVTLFLHGQPERFKLGSVRHEHDLSAYRWTVDEPEDFVFVEKVYGALYPRKPDFALQDILDYVKAHPAVAAINSHHQRNEGLIKSLAAEGGD